MNLTSKRTISLTWGGIRASLTARGMQSITLVVPIASVSINFRHKYLVTKQTSNNFRHAYYVRKAPSGIPFRHKYLVTKQKDDPFRHAYIHRDVDKLRFYKPYNTSGIVLGKWEYTLPSEDYLNENDLWFIIYVDGEFYTETNDYIQKNSTLYVEYKIGLPFLNKPVDIDIWAIAKSGDTYDDAADGLLYNKSQLEWNGSITEDVISYEIYSDNGDGTIDFDNPVAIVDAITGEEI